MNDPRTLHLSPLERKFFRLYVVAAQRDYHVMQTAVGLMNPDELGLICPAQATRLAEGIRELYLEFDEALTRLTSKHRFVRRATLPCPSNDELIGLITASFFKLVATVKSGPTDPGKTKDGGWFSGETEDWEKNLDSLKESLAPPKDQPPASPLITAMMQLFNALVNKKLPFQLYYQDMTAPPPPQPEDVEWEDHDDDSTAPEDSD